jgi:hypothetical protein
MGVLFVRFRNNKILFVINEHESPTYKYIKNTFPTCCDISTVREISGSHGSQYEDESLLGYSAL